MGSNLTLEFCGFKVIAVTCDVASTNRKFVRAHPSLDEDKKLSYNAQNPYSKKPTWVHFVSDLLYLIKTTRNANLAMGGSANFVWVS